jgi:hypothetical protein
MEDMARISTTIARSICECTLVWKTRRAWINQPFSLLFLLGMVMLAYKAGSMQVIGAALATIK